MCLYPPHNGSHQTPQSSRIHLTQTSPHRVPHLQMILIAIFHLLQASNATQIVRLFLLTELGVPTSSFNWVRRTTTKEWLLILHDLRCIDHYGVALEVHSVDLFFIFDGKVNLDTWANLVLLNEFSQVPISSVTSPKINYQVEWVPGHLLFMLSIPSIRQTNVVACLSGTINHRFDKENKMLRNGTVLTLYALHNGT